MICSGLTRTAPIPAASTIETKTSAISPGMSNVAGTRARRASLGSRGLRARAGHAARVGLEVAHRDGLAGQRRLAGDTLAEGNARAAARTGSGTLSLVATSTRCRSAGSSR